MGSLDPDSILGPKGTAARSPNYEHRVEQLRMAKAVAQAIEDETHLMVEAGTGIGKSFAYLVPAIQAAVEMGKTIVVSTKTKALQNQLMEKDIPFLRGVMPEEFNAELVVGRSNYLSLRRLEVAASRAGALLTSQKDYNDLAELRMWADQNKDGLRSSLSSAPSRSLWEAVESDSGNCLGRKCPTHRQCYFYKAQGRMRGANLLIVNHALYMCDLAMRGEAAALLPKHDVVIFDEAHELEAVATQHLGLRIQSGSVVRLLNGLVNERSSKGLLVHHGLNDAIVQAKRTMIEADQFFDEIAQRIKGLGMRHVRLREPLGMADTLGEGLRKLATAIADGSKDVEADEERIELESAQTRCEVLASEVGGWLAQSEHESIHWVERDWEGRRGDTLARAPLEVGPILRRKLFDSIPTCIMTSATMSIGSPPSFRFAMGRLGLVDCPSLHLGSPFDYSRQATLHLLKNLPDPSRFPAEFERAAIRAIPHYLAKTQGKALVLFTSYRMLKEAARELGPWLAEWELKLLCQNEEKSPSRMLEEFRSDVNSVIFGVDMFWQGVDIPGEALSNVIIARLPFTVPDHPLLEARQEVIERKGGRFFVEYSLPEAVIKFKQGFGRLIRASGDSGIVAVLDPRILSKPYGRTFLDSLPDCARVIEEFNSTGLSG